MDIHDIQTQIVLYLIVLGIVTFLTSIHTNAVTFPLGFMPNYRTSLLIHLNFIISKYIIYKVKNCPISGFFMDIMILFCSWSMVQKPSFQIRK